MTPTEIAEIKKPWLIERVEFAQDSGGPGRHAGGLGLDIQYRMLEESYLTTVIDITKILPQEIAGGGPARANGAAVRSPDGESRSCSQSTGLRMPAGWVLELATGGGGGYSAPSERPREAIAADLADGFISKDFVRQRYPQAAADLLREEVE